MKRNLLIVLGVTLFFALLGFRYRTEVKIGYAGDPQRYSDVLTITPLFLNREDIGLDRELSSSDHYQENSLRWSSSGYVPIRGDLVAVKEHHLTWYGKTIHVWGNTEFIPHYDAWTSCEGWSVDIYSFGGTGAVVKSGKWTDPDSLEIVDFWFKGNWIPIHEHECK